MSIIGAGTPPSSAGAPQNGSQGSPPPGGGDLIVDGSDATFQRDVLEASMSTPVIVDFWAPWCGPCKQLGPILEGAVLKARGAVKLVKIDVDQNPSVAGQLRVQSIPAVMAFDKGRPVDGFMGAMPASEIEKFIGRLTGGAPDPAEIEALLARAQAALEGGDPGGAAQDYAAVLGLDQENLAAVAGLVRCYLAGGDAERARELLDMVPEDKANDPAITGARAALALAEQGGQEAKHDDDLSALIAHLSGAPQDHAKRFELAQALAARGDLEAAVGHLLEIIKANREWNDGAAREELLKLFEAAGPTSSVTKDGRRQLSSILFS